MKLIREITEDVNLITETLDESTGKKRHMIEGIFLQSNIKNRNGRIYPKGIMENEVNRYQKNYINENRAFGELNHPTTGTINLDRVSHIITELKSDGDNFIGKARILDTPMGNIVKTLIDEGTKIGVSSRGMGSLKANKQGIMEVQNDFYLATAADIVADPSAPDAFVNGIMEGVDWIYDHMSRTWVPHEAEQISEKMYEEVSSMTVQEIEEKKFHILENFINKLSKKSIIINNQ